MTIYTDTTIIILALNVDRVSSCFERLFWEYLKNACLSFNACIRNEFKITVLRKVH